MLLDAVRGELYRFWHYATAVFWGLIFIPAIAFVTGVFWRAFLGGRVASVRDSLPPELIAASNTVDIGVKLMEKAAQLAEPGLMVFFLVAAAAIFATDYRWETWRLIRPRNSRENLILGKCLAVAALALVPMLGLLLAEGLGQLATAALDRSAIGFGIDIGHVGLTFMMVLVSWLRICQFTVLALLTAVITRSVAATIIVPIAIAVGTFMVQRMSGYFGWEATDWSSLLSFPGVGYEVIQSALMGAEISNAIVVRAVTGLVLWLAVPTALAVWLFQRQDLSKE